MRHGGLDSRGRGNDGGGGWFDAAGPCVVPDGVGGAWGGLWARFVAG